MYNIPNLHSMANALHEQKIKSILHRRQRNRCRAFEAGGRMGVKGRVSRFNVFLGNRSIRVEQMHLQSSAGVGLLLASRLGLTERERLFLLWLAEREREREREGERPLGLETERERERDLERLLTGVLDLLERAGEPDLLLRLE